MKITLLQVGKTKHSYIKDGIEEYLKRLQAFCDLEVVTIKEAVGEKDPKEQIKEEGEVIVKKISQYDQYCPILLDVKGGNPTSEQFAKQVRQIRDFGSGKILFIIGGPYGVSEEVIEVCQTRISFGKMTFTHQMIRLIFLEQLYRAFTIIEGKSYHH